MNNIYSQPKYNITTELCRQNNEVITELWNNKTKW